MIPSDASRIASRFAIASDRDLAVLSEQLARELQVPRRAHERDRDDVDVGAGKEREIAAVLLRQRLGADLPPRQVQALVREEPAAGHDPAMNVRSVDRLDPELDGAVGEEDACAGLDVLGEAFVRGLRDGFRALDLPRRQRELASLDQQYAALGQASDPELRALDVGQDRDRLALEPCRLADRLHQRPERRPVAMREVHAAGIDAAADQLANPLDGGRGGPDGRDDLRAVDRMHRHKDERYHSGPLPVQ
jgi:hypothetical protein